MKNDINSIFYKSGIQIPCIGLGTFKLQGKTATRTIRTAYELGYRLFDTATLYQNHQAISHAIKDLPREELSIASKINEVDLETSSVIQACEKILSELKTHYLDIFFIHHPLIGDLKKILEDMILLKDRQLIRCIGISNFNNQHLNTVVDYLDFIDVNQIEVHPFLIQPEIYNLCAEKNIKVMAYRPFALNLIANNHVLREISDKYHKSPHQIVLRWLLQTGFQVIPKATSHEHLKENMNLFHFELNDEDIGKILSLNKKQRTCSGAWSKD